MGLAAASSLDLPKLFGGLLRRIRAYLALEFGAFAIDVVMSIVSLSVGMAVPIQVGRYYMSMVWEPILRNLAWNLGTCSILVSFQ